MKNELSNLHKTLFEQIKQVDKEGNEWWSARQLGKVLEYSEYRHFKPVIDKAKEACVNSSQEVSDHFEEFLEMVDIGSGAQRPMGDGVKLSRYACYLIVQNADPSKEVVAQGQTIEEIGGTMPEDLPVAESIKKLEKAKEPKMLNTPKKKK